MAFGSHLMSPNLVLWNDWSNGIVLDDDVFKRAWSPLPSAERYSLARSLQSLRKNEHYLKKQCLVIWTYELFLKAYRDRLRKAIFLSLMQLNTPCVSVAFYFYMYQLYDY